MNKREKQIYSSSLFSIWSSTVAQFLNTTNNTKYLFYASREKNFIYFNRGNYAIDSIDITIGTTTITKLLPVTASSDLFIDISEIVRLNEGKIIDMLLFVRPVGYSPISISYKVVLMEGYSIDTIAQFLNISQSNYCNLLPLAGLDYSGSNSLSYFYPPTKIIIPYENGVRKFSNLSTIKLPMAQQNYGNANVDIYQGSIVSSASNTYNFISINVANVQGGNANLRVIGNVVNKVNFEQFNSNNKYVAVKWKSPIINATQFDSTGSSVSYSQIASYMYNFFELVEYEESNEITSLESTASYMPYLVNSSVKCKLRLSNLTAYDYIYYSQILKSTDVQVLFDYESEITLDNAFQPAKLEKTKLVYPTNGTNVYNLEFNLILTEND